MKIYLWKKNNYYIQHDLDASSSASQNLKQKNKNKNDSNNKTCERTRKETGKEARSIWNLGNSHFISVNLYYWFVESFC